MSSRGTGLTLSLGIVAGFIGYILWQVTIGLNTKVDDVQTILTNSASGSTVLQISVVTQSANVAANTVGGILAGVGWLFLGIAYRGSDAKGALSFIPLGWLALIAGLILIVSNLVVSPLVSIEVASQISGISFILIVLWSVLRGIALIQED